MSRHHTGVTTISDALPTAAAQPACLVEIHGLDLGRRVVLDGAALLGRSSKCDVQVDQEAVSRTHARLVPADGGYRLDDLGSTNGTYVNDVQIDSARLVNGDLVRLGHTVFKFLEGANLEAAWHEAIHRVATTDGLTGVTNKRQFQEVLQHEIARARRYGRPLGLVLLDVDHFKSVNDRHGHLVGDRVLMDLAGLLRGNVRQEDTVARWGGEEFAVVLPEVAPDGVRACAEKLRQVVEAHEVRLGAARLGVTVSLGTAGLSDGLTEAEELVAAADRRLYRAKAGGRNRTVSTD